MSTGHISVACHVHSKWSYDGKWSLGDIAREFGRRGYRAVMMTEHDRGFTEAKWQDYQAACAAASSSELLLVPGIEYSDPTNVVHVLVWGVSRFLGEALLTSDLLARVQQEGAIAVLAHPSRLAAWERFDPAWVKNLLGIESWNRKTDGWAPSRTATALFVDNHLLKFAGLDFHDRRQFFPLAMRVNLKGQVGMESILEAMHAANASPCVFGRPFANMLNPAGAFVFSMAEGIRRPLARGLRRITRFGHRQPNLARQAA